MQQRSTSDFHGSVPPEFELLLLCARTKQDQAEESRIETLVQHDLDWAGFIRQAIDHQVLPLVHQTLRGVAQERIPPEVMEELRQLSGAILRRNLFLFTKLLQAVDLLKTHEIPMIPYKGPVVASLAYGNIGLRQFSDIDILVSPSRYRQARELLLANGYVLAGEWDHEARLVDGLDGADLDLHRTIMPKRIPFLADFEALEQNLTPIVVAGREIVSLSPEDTLIVLCVQMVKDAAGIRPLLLIKVCDIAELLRAHPDMNCQAVVRKAETLGCAGMVAFGLLMARQLLDAPVPDLSLPSPGPRDLQLLSEHVTDRLANQWSPGFGARLGAKRFHFKVRERWRDKLYPYVHEVARALTPTDLDREFFPLPRRFWPMYFFLRPVRLLRDRYQRFRCAAESEVPSPSTRQNSDTSPGPDSSKH